MGGFLHLVLTIQFLGDPNDLTHIHMDHMAPRRFFGEQGLDEQHGQN
jgi:hypothetical protein